MAEPKKSDAGITEERWKNFKEKLAKTEAKQTEEILKQIATRNKLERDFNEDLLQITFKTSPETERTILSKRPSHDQVVEILRIMTSAAMIDKVEDPEKLHKITSDYAKLPKIAAELSVDKSLDEKFWSKTASSMALQNFLNAVIAKSMEPVGLTPSEMKSFR